MNISNLTLRYVVDIDEHLGMPVTNPGGYRRGAWIIDGIDVEEESDILRDTATDDGDGIVKSGQRTDAEAKAWAARTIARIFSYRVNGWTRLPVRPVETDQNGERPDGVAWQPRLIEQHHTLVIHRDGMPVLRQEFGLDRRGAEAAVRCLDREDAALTLQLGSDGPDVHSRTLHIPVRRILGVEHRIDEKPRDGGSFTRPLACG